MALMEGSLASSRESASLPSELEAESDCIECESSWRGRLEEDGGGTYDRTDAHEGESRAALPTM